MDDAIDADTEREQLEHDSDDDHDASNLQVPRDLFVRTPLLAMIGGGCIHGRIVAQNQPVDNRIVV